MASTDFTPWSTLRRMPSSVNALSWVPEDDRERLSAYQKYDELYWNDPRQFAVRVLENEEPVYIPNARTVVDTTSHYLLKGLTVSAADPKDKKLAEALDVFLKREMFFSRFHTAKHAGVARGDFVFHMTANPDKAEGSRISLNSVDPSMVFPIYHDDIPDKMIGCHIVAVYYDADDPSIQKVRKLTYRLVEEEDSRRISREEGIYEMSPTWYGPEPKKVREIIPLGFLDDRITEIPIYWFKNINWDGWQYGSSELKGLESLISAVTQQSTDVQGSLSLEGLGVYATDGGRPVDSNGTETDWEIAPGRVVEVPQGSYFRRVEGVGSITPATDQINYLESKMREVSGLTDIALGRVELSVAQSGIALAIRFMPTLAKIEERDKAGVERLTQLFYNWKVWHEVFEHETLSGEVLVKIGEKLPQNRTERINELNNMLDRNVISREYYRQEMKILGYEFPDTIADDILKELEAAAEIAALAVKGNTADDDEDSSEKLPSNEGEGLAEQQARNKSNNRNRPNESGGTEVTVEK